MDQVPLAFASSHDRTLTSIAEECAIAEPESGDTKRMGTLQVTICAEPSQQLVKLELIFRGMGIQLTDEEMAHYDSLTNIRIRWQTNAWADEGICIQYLTDFRRDTIELGEVLLGMDRHTAQSTMLCQCFMEKFGIVQAYTPPNCTDVVSPVDHHVGAALKGKIYDMYEEQYEKEWVRFNAKPGDGGLEARHKRMMVATWSSKAWDDLCKNHHHLIRKAFVSTGFLLAKDGSENHLVSLGRDFKGKYDF